MARQPETIDWRTLLEGDTPAFRRFRSALRRIPTSPRCKLCAAPFAGPGAPFMRLIGRAPWEKNPSLCGVCFKAMAHNHGGAEIAATLLFSDVRGSTGLAERMSTADYARLLNRFYDAATRVLVAHDGIVDKFVGDEVVGIFIRLVAGDDHAAHAVTAARALLEATGHDQPDGPWIPIGAGVHTGIAYVGAVGEGVTDFTALGDSVNTTARLASAAAAGEILVSRAAAEAAGLVDDGSETRHLELRGRTEPVDVVVLRTGSVAVPA